MMRIILFLDISDVSPPVVLLILIYNAVERTDRYRCSKRYSSSSSLAAASMPKISTKLPIKLMP